jgi:methylase of polypeptide subunit release factors
MVRDEEAPLLALLAELRSRDYRFTCVTPTTHEQVVGRPLDREPTLRDIFGWSRPFAEDNLPPELLRLLHLAGCVEETGGRLRSLVRAVSLEERLFLHSSFPTTSPDAVFFGPDTYRFVRFVLANQQDWAGATRIVDMGAGTGAGGIIVAGCAPSAQVTLVDINSAALELARVNAEAAGVHARITLAERMPESSDLVIANPPYLMDDAHRTYRDGGGMLGGNVAHDWASQALRVLAPGGTMLLYTGAAFVEGTAPLLDRVESLCREAGAALDLEEIDPDVFGEELERPDYRNVERIAAVGIRIRKPD